MVPIYAIDSFFSLLFRKYSLIFDILRDCYEAYVLYLFFTLLVNYFDGEEQLIHILRSKDPISHPFPTCFLPKFKPGKRFLNWCKLCVLQFTIIKPLTTFLALFLNFGFVSDLYGDGEIFEPNKAYLYFTLIENLSITISLYFLVLFYLATKEELAPFKPVPKFLCIKAIIFFSFWQGVVIALLSMASLIHTTGGWTKDQITTGAQDFLICIEMFLVSLAHMSVFGYQQFRNPNKTPFLRSIFSGKVKESTLPLLKNLSDAVNPKYDIQMTKDVINQAPIFTMQSPFEKKRGRILDVLSPTDNDTDTDNSNGSNNKSNNNSENDMI